MSHIDFSHKGDLIAAAVLARVGMSSRAKGFDFGAAETGNGRYASACITTLSQKFSLILSRKVEIDHPDLYELFLFSERVISPRKLARLLPKLRAVDPSTAELSCWKTFRDNINSALTTLTDKITWTEGDPKQT
ncbi:MAG: hypothetical protein WBE13_03910 [Candidatus Acidiferrum sp.]